MSSYPAIIFDLGGVVINLAMEKTLHSFQEKIPGFPEDQFVGRRDQHEIYNRYETGVTDTGQFYREFREHYQTDLNFESFKESWNAMILDLPKERIELLRSLRARGVRVFLLSNINPLHAEAVEPIYDALHLGGHFREQFERAYYSYEMGLRKPDPKIFGRIIGENGLTLEKTLFIDDSLQHIESAKRLGSPTIHLLKGQSIDKLSL